MRIKFFILVLILIFGIEKYVVAQEKKEEKKEKEEVKELTEDEVITGEVHIQLNSDYCKFTINDEETENYSFTDNGFTLIIYSVNRKEKNKISMKPVNPEFEETEIIIEPKDWKLKKINKNVKMWIAEKKINFSKKKKEIKKGEKK